MTLLFAVAMKNRYLACAFLVLLSGCNDPYSWQASTFPTSGSIMINGENPEGALVILKSIGQPPDAHKSEPWGLVKEDGTYEMSTYALLDGVPEGEYAVTVIWHTIPGTNSPDRMNNAFRDIENSPQRVKIIRGSNLIPKIELVDVKMTPVASDKKKSTAGSPAVGSPASGKRK